MANKLLAGKKVAVLVESGYVPEEIHAYRQRFGCELGAEVCLLSRLWGKDSLTCVSDVDAPGRRQERLRVERDFQNEDPGDYAAVIAAAGYTSVRLRYFQPPAGPPIRPQHVRASPAVEFFAQAMRNPRVIKGALCHGLWLLTPRPELLTGRRVICHEVILADVINAGAIYKPSPAGVVVDGDLVTGRSKDDVDLFIDRIAEQILRPDRGEPLRFAGEQARDQRRGQLKVLVVLSSFGFWGEELVAPLEEFDRAGIAHELATPYGHPPAVVPVSTDPDYVDPQLKRKVTSPQMAQKVKKLLASDRLRAVKAVGDVHVDDFDGLLLVGGSGPILDMNNCRELHDLVRQCAQANKVVAAECYAIGALAYTRDLRDPRRRSVLWGRTVTGHPIPHDYVAEYGYAGVTSSHPFRGPAVPLEYVLRDAVGPDGEFRGNLDREISVVEDLPFITSRSVAESAECGRRLVARLKERAAAAPS